MTPEDRPVPNVAAPPSAGAVAPPEDDSRAILPGRRLWLVVLGVGALLWVVTGLIAGVTDVANLIPNVLVVGSFLVPVVAVLFVLSRPVESSLTPKALLLGFLGGGTVGTLFAAVTEVYFLPTAAGTFVGVGLFEEGAKLLILVAVASVLDEHRPRDGLVLGATVGAGFAAFESTGYAFQTFMNHTGDHAILDIAGTEAQRAVLAPFGHITWTALVGGAIFAAWKSERFGPVAPVVWTFAGVIALHAAWDASYGWAILLAQGLEGNNWSASWPNTEAWIGTPSGSELAAFNVAYCLLLGLNATIGTLWVIQRWRSYGRSARAAWST
jgi:protease PrsW